MIKTDFINLDHAQHSDNSLPFGAGLERVRRISPESEKVWLFSYLISRAGNIQFQLFGNMQTNNGDRN
jgi:hypothetical protein